MPFDPRSWFPTQVVALQDCIAEVEEIYLDRLSEKANQTTGQLANLQVEALCEAISLKHQVIGNLLTNAIKFSRPGGTIDINLEDHGPTVDIIIRDHGIGMSKSNLVNLFARGHEYLAIRNSGGKGHRLRTSLSLISLYRHSMVILRCLPLKKIRTKLIAERHSVLPSTNLR